MNLRLEQRYCVAFNFLLQPSRQQWLSGTTFRCNRFAFNHPHTLKFLYQINGKQSISDMQLTRSSSSLRSALGNRDGGIDRVGDRNQTIERFEIERIGDKAFVMWTVDVRNIVGVLCIAALASARLAQSGRRRVKRHTNRPSVGGGGGSCCSGCGCGCGGGGGVLARRSSGWRMLLLRLLRR